MDVISNKNNEAKSNEYGGLMVGSSISLSKYEQRSYKTLFPQITASILAAAFNIVYGISLAYSAILLPQMQAESKNGTNPDAIHLSESEGSWIASVIVIVVPVAAIIGGILMDTIGRLRIIILSSLPSAAGWLIIAVAGNVPLLILGRILTGVGSAWGTGPAIVYITEIARIDMRGSLISIAPAYCSLGMVLAYLFGWFMNWRYVAWVCVGCSLAPILMMLFIPESPPWLISKGQYSKAKKSLDWINRNQPDTEVEGLSYTNAQFSILKKEHERKMEEQRVAAGNSFQKKLRMFLLPTCYKPLLILAGLFFFQQFSGTYITLFYAVHFFQDVGTNVNPYLASIFLGTIRFIMSIVNTFLMKRLPRRTLMLISVIGMSSCMGISGIFTKLIHNGETDQKWVPVAMLVVYVMTSMIGLLSIPWTIIAELFPIAIRGVAHSLVYSIANLIMFGAIQSYFSLVRLLGGSAGLQFFFAIISLGGLLYSFIFLPETHNKKLTEIEDYFLHNTIYISCGKKKKLPTKAPIVIYNQTTENNQICSMSKSDV